MTAPITPPPPASTRLRWALPAMAVASAVLTGAIAAHGFFWYDDFWHLQVAHDLGWSWSFLGRPIYGHVIPGWNLLVGLVAGPGHRTYGAAIIELALIGALVPVAAHAAARSLGARPVPAVVAAAMATLAAPIAIITTWWSAGLLTYPSMLGGMGIVVGTQAMKRGARWGAPFAAVTFAVGLLSNEGAAVLILPPVVIALLWDPGSWRERVAAVWRRRVGWAAVASPLALEAIVRANASSRVVQYSAHPSLVDLVRFPFAFLVKGYLPGTFGLAISTVGHVELLGSAGLTIAVGILGTLALGWWLWRFVAIDVGRIGAVILLTVLARGVIVAWGRLVLFGWQHSVEGRYYADLMWLLPVLVAARWPHAQHRAGAARVDSRSLGLAGVLCAVGLVGQIVIAVGAPAVHSRSYRDHLAASWEQVPPGTALVDVMAPPSIIGPELSLFTFLSRTIAQGLPVTYAPSGDLVAPDGDGTLHPIQLSPYSQLLPARAFTAVGQPGTTTRDGCWVAGDAGALVWVPLSIPVVRTAWVLDLRLSGPSDRRVSFVAAGNGPQQFLVVSPEGRSRSRWIVSAGAFEAAEIGFQLPPDASLCLRSGALTFPERTG